MIVRLLRALWVFGLILGSYLLQIGLGRVCGRRTTDDERVLPPWLVRRRERIDTRNARRLLRSMLRLRGVYIKLGQVLSIMGGFLPRAYGRELESLQDRVPPHRFRDVRRRFREDFGKSPEAMFARIENEPIAAASLGQVHAAWLPDGRKVAVKILYPRIREVIRTDLKVIGLAIRVYNRFVPVQNLSSVHAALVDLLRRETDYLHEAGCMGRMATCFAGSDDVLFPEVIAEFTTRNILTMTFMEGIKITHVEAITAAGANPKAVARRLVEMFFEQIFVHHYFHADPHPGNFLVQVGSDGRARIVVLDFGAICEVPEAMADGMIDVLQGFFEQNDELVLRGFDRMGFVADGGDRALVEQTVLSYFRKLLAIQDRSAGALMRAKTAELERLADPEVARRNLRALMRSIRYPDGWFYVERASVLLFWLVGQIDPDLDGLEVGFPIIVPLLAQRTAGAAD